MEDEKYERPNPLISGQTKPENKELLDSISKAHGVTRSELVGEAIDLAIPKLVKRYPLPDAA